MANERQRALAAQETGQTMFVRTEGGSVIEMSLPLSEPIADRVAKGEIVRVNEDGSTYVEPAVEDQGDVLEEPAGNASKADWVEWAVSKGADPAEAEACTRDDLRKTFGTPPAEG